LTPARFSLVISPRRLVPLRYRHDCYEWSPLRIMESFVQKTMSTMNWEEHIKQVEGIAGDRRSDRRYDLRLDLRWKLIRRRRILETGTGETVDFSSGGVLFDPGRPMPLGLNVELAVSWPVLLHNTAPLQLVISGRIVRSQDNRTAIQMTQHEFRTVGNAERRSAASGRPPLDFFSRPALAVR